MKFKILEPNKPDDWSFNDDEELYKALGFNAGMTRLFAY